MLGIGCIIALVVFTFAFFMFEPWEIQHKIGFWGMLATLALFAAWLFSLAMQQEAAIMKDALACEAKGGIYLRHTYSVGKTNTSETVGCFRKDAIIP